MYRKYLVAVIACLIGGTLVCHAQNLSRKIDTSMKVGKAGYRVNCSNKNADKNSVTITPLGFESGSREFSFELKGRISKAEVDDINRDGFPDLVLYTFTNDSIPRGSVIAIASEKNESVTPIGFPDIFDDPKIRVGYKGNDQFFLMEGNLVRRFPVYPVEGAPAAAANGNLMRQVHYSVIADERGNFKFKSTRSYDFTK